MIIVIVLDSNECKRAQNDSTSSQTVVELETRCNRRARVPSPKSVVVLNAGEAEFNVTGCCIAIVAKGIAMISTDSSAAIGISTRRGVGNVRKRMKPMRSQDQVALRILGRNTWDTTICSECCGNAQILAVGAHFEIISFGMEAYVLAWYGVLCHVVTWILQPATREKMRMTLRHLSM